MNSEVKLPPAPRVDHDPELAVELPRSGTPRFLVLLVGVASALLLFLFLDAQRRAAQRAAEVSQTTPNAFQPPPPLVVPPETLVAPQIVPRGAVEPTVPVFAPPLQYLPPSAAPARPPPAPPPYTPPELHGEQVVRQDMRPLPPPARTDNRASPLETRSNSSALVIDSAASEIPLGTLIPAVLETPIDTSRPGFARAIVSLNALGADGRRVVVPRGSRLIGEYRSDVRAGQSRVLVNWTRLVFPDGNIVRLGVPAADALGGAGIPGRVHGFFLTRFLGSAIQTALSVGGNLLGGRSGNTVIVGVPNGGPPAMVGQGLVGSDDRRPKITVKQGTLFNVFVSRDVDFAAVPVAETAPAAPEQ